MSPALKIFSYVCIIWLTASTRIFSLSPNTLARFKAYVWNGTDYSGLHALADDQGRNKPANAHFFTNQLYFAYGIYHNINLWLGFDFLVTSATSDTDVGLGDGRIGAKFSIIKQLTIPLGLALETSSKVPLSDYDTGKVNAFGEGQADFNLGLILGHKLSDFPMNFALGSGYRFRFAGTPDQLYMAFEVNSQYFSSLGIKLKFYFYHSFKGLEYGEEEFNRRTQENAGELPFPKLKAKFANIALELEYYMTSRSTLGGKFGYTVYSRNAGILYTAGISLGYYLAPP